MDEKSNIWNWFLYASDVLSFKPSQSNLVAISRKLTERTMQYRISYAQLTRAHTHTVSKIVRQTDRKTEFKMSHKNYLKKNN